MPMSDSDYHSMPPTEEREGGIGCIPVTLCALVGLAMIYMAGLGCFFRGEEKAPTQAEFMSWPSTSGCGRPPTDCAANTPGSLALRIPAPAACNCWWWAR